MPFINALYLFSWIFGRKGEVIPIVLVVSDLAKEQQHYYFTFITHAAHNQKYRGELFGFVQTTGKHFGHPIHRDLSQITIFQISVKLFIGLIFIVYLSI
jgi:hypothetical protein